MTYRPHIRMTMQGSLPGGEIFSMGVNLGIVGEIDTPLLFVGDLAPNSDVYDDLAADCLNYWVSTFISSRAKLQLVKFAPIGTDGRYSGPSTERLISAGTGGVAGSSSGTHHPNQVALAVTLHSTGDLGKVKGRFYLPMPSLAPGTDGRLAEADRDAVETEAQEFINAVNNQPGLDVLNIRAIVASQGRRNKDGSVKFAPRNWDVNAVSVGRTLDTVRRRRNKVNELRGTPSSVS